MDRGSARADDGARAAAGFRRALKEFGALKQQLLDAKGDAVAGMTMALKGAGGYGKTTLAKALARDPDIQDAFFDGVLWAELGEKLERSACA